MGVIIIFDHYSLHTLLFHVLISELRFTGKYTPSEKKISYSEQHHGLVFENIFSICSCKVCTYCKSWFCEGKYRMLINFPLH